MFVCLFGRLCCREKGKTHGQSQEELFTFFFVQWAFPFPQMYKHKYLFDGPPATKVLDGLVYKWKGMTQKKILDPGKFLSPLVLTPSYLKEPSGQVTVGA